MAQSAVEQLPATEKKNFSRMDSVLIQNLRDVSGRFDSEAYRKYADNDLIFSQFDMSMVHTAFFQTVVMFPQSVTTFETFFVVLACH